ncbi:hypothetical protein [Microbulbifer yueqingensis]|uniref:ABC-type transport auxiliary lipoprotein component domain-containing protein n=1 Tax=Microbulbifer yueqingensis TaxID=658219 RepID=A0A1G8VZ90_9GAMM|nr:hypothetical protein [Microbulbifer yueqingensis]SDJ71083.1 hypothetical protein SAMN05216212_0788 [Microbulbifer yueqingensis]
MALMKKGLSAAVKATLLVTAMLVTACTHTVQVDGEYPQPVGDQYPLTVGFYLSDDFSRFTYHEDSEDRDEWNISTGPAQRNLFATVLGSMFTEAIPLTSYPQDLPENVELVIVPEVRELQFTMPRETRVNIFEVWIKYDMHAYDNQGAQVANWVITAYGKTPTAFLKSQEAALAQAIDIALRDAGATLYTGFDRVPELQALVASKQRAISMQEQPAAEAGDTTD